MTMTSPALGARAWGLNRISRAIALWFARLREKRRIRREHAGLASLPDHMLRDMGLDRHVGRPKRTTPPMWR